MSRRTLPALTALATATALLLLTACGGESSEPDEEMPGAGESSAKASASASPSEGEGEAGTGAIDRPQIKLPKDVELEFNWEKPSGAEEAAVLGDTQEYLRSVIFGITEQDPESSAYKFYSVPAGSGAAYAKEQIKSTVDAGYSVTGVQRFSSAKVKLMEDSLASVTYCQNEDEFFNKEVDSGKTLKGDPGSSNTFHFQVVLEEAKKVKGLWRVKAIEGDRGAAACAGQ
ncbi:hypothetical protein [Streptomyces koyangensis]|uniref:Lipoprotein n=1 Tax=Streptomyces koyangensis TaxID=188770 RepID=A0A385DC36_9ACTN|nr:hypothetical protein [Streptomyces koyangensis]AXQ55474.1 hypothetical protein D0C37_13270 [Streptomyces koyangensis]